MTIKEFFRLIRVKSYSITSSVIVIGFLYSGVTDIRHLGKLAYVFFALMTVYSGLYIANDVADYQCDLKNPDKVAVSPLLKGKITRVQAMVFAIVLVLCGLYTMALVGKFYALIAVAFISVNVLYTLVLKKVPYLEFLANALTYPLRFWLGYAIASSDFSVTKLFPAFLVTLLICTGFSITKRIVELSTKKDLRIRPTLKFYSIQGLVVLKAGVLLLNCTYMLTIDEPIVLKVAVILLQVVEFLLLSKKSEYVNSIRKVCQ